MEKKIENILYFKAGVSFDHLKLAIKTFEAYLATEGTEGTPVYYRARNFLRDGEKYYQETLSEAKKLLGPLPPYSSADFEKWRKDFLSQHRIQIEAQEYDQIKEELAQNGQLSQWIGSEDIERLLVRDYEAQKVGKRKLANIKVRIILDRLQELLGRAGELKNKAMAKFQSST
jgi:hypothetical protein